MGHWAGDQVCPASTGKGGGKSKSKGRDGKSSSSTSSQGASTAYSHSTKKAFVVTYGDTPLFADDDDDDDGSHGSQRVHRAFPAYNMVDDGVTHSYVTERIDFAGYMILDAACQRSCAGTIWMSARAKILNNHHFGVFETSCSDRFQFGAGVAQTSTTRAYFPAAFAGQDTQGLVMGVNLLDLQLPFLASCTLLERLGCIIDVSEGLLHFTTLQVTLNLEKRHGHLVACITNFPSKCRNMTCWNELGIAARKKPDPELLTSEAVQAISADAHLPDIHVEQLFGAHLAMEECGVAAADGGSPHMCHTLTVELLFGTTMTPRRSSMRTLVTFDIQRGDSGKLFALASSSSGMPMIHDLEKMVNHHSSVRLQKMILDDLCKDQSLAFDFLRDCSCHRKPSWQFVECTRTWVILEQPR